MADEQVAPSPEVYFEPIVKLPLVEIKTMEEEEEILFQMRAKLFRYDTSTENPEWKERGTGEIKILKHRSEDFVRILMRRDKTFKVCANHYIQPYMELKPNNTSDRAWIWNTLADFADEEPKPELLAIKFANVENAQKFKVAFEKAKQLSTSKAKFEGNEDKESSAVSSSDDNEESEETETDVSKENADVSKDDTKAEDSVNGEGDAEEIAVKLEDLSIKKESEDGQNDSSKSPKTVK